jgi:hypothetical protein
MIAFHTLLVRMVMFFTAAVLAMFPGHAYAHCDTEDGPVVSDARMAIETNDVTPVLKWVAPEDEEQIRTLFTMTMAVRAMGAEARQIADAYFFETLVRLHRANENAPFTGLKPAGSVEPPVAAADKAIADGSVDNLARHVAEAAEESVREKYAALMEARRSKDKSVEEGRKYVAAYVQFVHHVEGLHNTIHAKHHH